MTENYTPIPVAKWSASSLIKQNDLMWSNFLKVMLDTDVYTKEEKNRRIDSCLTVTKLVHDLVLRNELKLKKS